MKLNLGTLLLGVPLLVYMAWMVRDLPWTPMRVAGLAIGVPALVLLIVARVQLGQSFSVQARANQLVTTGLYSRMRNPIYVFGLLAVVGFFLWTARPVLLLLVVGLIPLQLRRMRREEQVLQEKFGQEYLEYRRRTWF